MPNRGVFLFRIRPGFESGTIFSSLNLVGVPTLKVDFHCRVIFYVRTDVNFNWFYVRKLKYR